MKTYKYLLKQSVFSRILLAILVGLFAKLITLPIFIVYYYGLKFFGKTYGELATAVASNSEAHRISVSQAISILVLAPIIENLVIPLIFWLCSHVYKKPILPIFFITLLAYFYHQAGSPQITGAVFFFCYAAFYSQCVQVVGRKESYLLTVIAHFVTNLIAFSFMMALSKGY